MRELVGHCKECGKEVYCNDGFFTGVVLEDKSIICFECEEKDKEKAKDKPAAEDPELKGTLS